MARASADSAPPQLSDGALPKLLANRRHPSRSVKSCRRAPVVVASSSSPSPRALGEWRAKVRAERRRRNDASLDDMSSRVVAEPDFG